jgi:hypothetical protein
MSRVITFSRVFPSYHPRAGEPTHFVEKIWQSLGGVSTEYTNNFMTPNYKDSIVWGYQLVKGGPKVHTIRSGHRWKKGDWFSPRVWSGKPYNSKMIQFAPDIQIKKVWDIELCLFGKYNDVLMTINGQPPKQAIVNTVPINDGLTIPDFSNWFCLSSEFKKKKEFEGQIISWNESINY